MNMSTRQYTLVTSHGSLSVEERVLAGLVPGEAG
jgi:hypothetical protein